MEFLRAQSAQIVEQLRGMSVSQRVAVVLLAVVLVGGMFGLIRWGGQGEWMPLLDQSFTSDQLQRVQAELAAVAGATTKVEGDRIFMQGDEDKRRQLMAVLAQHGALPHDTSAGYSSLIKDNSVFVGDRSRMWMEHRGLETELSSVLRKFQGVRDAHVFIEVPQVRGFGAAATNSRASVHVTLDEGQSLDKPRIMAIANFVAGAVSGLDLKDVKITDGARSYRLPDTGGDMPTELLDIQRQAEEHHTQKIYDQLRYIPGVLVNVHAALQTAEEQIQEKKLGPAIVDQETSKTEESGGANAASAPGVRPNQGRSLTDAGAGVSNNREETDTSLRGERDAKLQTTLKRAGFIEKLTASVNVPKSYLDRILAQQAGGDKSIDKVASAELPKIKALVKPLINAANDDQVVVNWYYDVQPGEQKAAAETRPVGWAAAAKDYGPQAGLGLLAVISLLGVLRIAKRAQVSLAGPAVKGAAAMAWTSAGGSAGGVLQPLDGSPQMVGEAREIDGVMVGHEVDENTVRVQQIVKQIGQMIRDDPTAAAGIVQHWLAQEQ